MMKTLLSFLLFSLFLGISQAKSKDSESVTLYTLKNIENDFKRMKQAGINADKPLTWSFFITGYTEESLFKSTENFEKAGFTPISIQSDIEDSFYRLKLTTRKIYTVESFFEDTQAIEKIVNELKLRSFENVGIEKN